MTNNLPAVIPQEQVEMSRKIIALEREKHRLAERVEALEAMLETERRAVETYYKPLAHKHFRERLEGYANRKRHAELRADFASAGAVMLRLLAVAFVAQEIFLRIWRLRP